MLAPGSCTRVVQTPPRTFRPNLQEVTAIVDGAPTRVKASTRAIRSGMVIKPLKRKYGYTRQQKGQPAH